jgi:aerobic C4-dicarboxylate transport protein
MATVTTIATTVRKPLYASLFIQVLAALVLGIVLGMTVPDFAISLKILSDAFLKLISMIVAPIVFCVVVHGIAGAGDLKKVGRVGVKALIYFEGMTTVALIVGLLLATPRRWMARRSQTTPAMRRSSRAKASAPS